MCRYARTNHIICAALPTCCYIRVVRLLETMYQVLPAPAIKDTVTQLPKGNADIMRQAAKEVRELEAKDAKLQVGKHF